MSMYPIASQTLTTSSSGITFSSIPSNFTHLQLRIFVADSGSADITFNFNGDSSGNYVQHNLYGDGSSASSYFYGAGSTYITFAFPYQGLASSTSFASIVMDILDYANTNKYKTTRSIGGIDRNGTGFVATESGLWRSNAAITSIAIAPTTGTFTQYSTFQLYGITTA